MNSQETFDFSQAVRQHLAAACHCAKALTHGKDPAAAQASDSVMPRRLELRRNEKTILKVSPTLALAALFLGLKKPKLLILSGAALLVTRTDVALVCPGSECSLKNALFNRSKVARGNVQDIKERLDDRFHDLKEQAFHRDEEQGQRYFTIKL